MLKTYLTNDDLFKFEPALEDYLRQNQTDFQDQIDMSFEVLIQDLKSNGLKIKRLCTPLTIQASTSQTTSYSGSAIEDEIERRFWVLTVTANSGACIFTLDGSNDGTTFTEIMTQTITEAGVYTNLITANLYDYYRVRFSGTSSTYSSTLLEESFFLSHLYLTLWKIYTSLQANVNDFWESKSTTYWDQYQTTLKSIKFSYDEDDSGDVSDDEGVKTYRPRFTR